MKTVQDCAGIQELLKLTKKENNFLFRLTDNNVITKAYRKNSKDIQRISRALWCFETKKGRINIYPPD